jgi:hypothetical protein
MAGMATSSAPASQARRAQLRARWEALLRAQPACSPLAHPDTVVHLLDPTLDTLFAAPRRPATRPLAPARPCRDSCRCGLNPLLAFFAVGEQALRETAEQPASRGDAKTPPAPADTIRLSLALRRLARDELETFCSLCQRACASPFTSPSNRKRGSQAGPPGLNPRSR